MVLVVALTFGTGRPRELCGTHESMARDYIEDMRRDFDEPSGDPAAPRCPVCDRTTDECMERGVQCAQLAGARSKMRPKIGRWVHPRCVEFWNMQQKGVDR